MTFTDKEKKLIGHRLLYYELEQFWRCFHVLTERAKEAKAPIPDENAAMVDNLIGNVFLEAMLIHARLLLDFFNDRGKRKDDVICSDLALASQPELGPPREQLQLPHEYHDRIHKEVAHLSYFRGERLLSGNKRWRYAFFLPLVQRCIDFIEIRLERGEEMLLEVDRYLIQNGQKPVSLESWRRLMEGLIELRRDLEPSAEATHG